MSTQRRWDDVYATKANDEVSWYRPHLQRSLALIERASLDQGARIVDVGAGASTLVDDLLERGYTNLAIMDLSSHAIERARARAPHAADRVDWLVGDVTTHRWPAHSVDLWHDRAVFHFMVESEARGSYVRRLTEALRPGGYVVMATFAPDGPERCSGLPTMRYAPDALCAALGEEFDLLAHDHHVHTTPWGSEQAFTHALCRRRPAM